MASKACSIVTGKPSPAGAALATATQRRLAAVWSDLLNVQTVYADHDFFELGGHSMMAARLVSRVRQDFGVELPLARVFEHARLAALAAVIDELAAQGAAAAPAIQPAARTRVRRGTRGRDGSAHPRRDETARSACSARAARDARWGRGRRRAWCSWVK